MLADVETILTLADEQIGQVRAIYQDSLRATEAPPRLKALVKSILEQQRSTLDFITHAVVSKHGSSVPRQVYWPYAEKAADFGQRFNANLPGVAQALPALETAWSNYQPYTPGYDWLADLVRLVNPNKHVGLTPQTKFEHRSIHFEGRHGSSVLISEGFSITISGGSSFLIDGVPIHQTPRRLEVRVGWLFEGTAKPVMPTIERIQAGLRPMIDDLCALAGL